MPALSNKHYFNYGGQGPLPYYSLEAIKSSWQTIQELGPFTGDVWPYISKEINSTRKEFSRLCDIPSNRIALTENVTTGCVLPLWGLPFSPGDSLLISDCEHPGVVAACNEIAYRKKLSIDILPVKQIRHGKNSAEITKNSVLESLEQSIRPRTKLVVISHILWNTGQIMPISSIASILATHPNRPFLLVDAAQSFCQICIKEAAKNADIYAFTGHKWACGPEGLGGVALSERVLEEANPTIVGWRTLISEDINKINDANIFHKDARRFEIGTSCVPLLAGLRCSLKLLEDDCPINKRLEKICQLSAHLWNELNNIKYIDTILREPPPAGLVSFTCNTTSSTKELVKQLGKQGIWIRDIEDPVCLRACVHITTNRGEIECLRKEVSKLIIQN